MPRLFWSILPAFALAACGSGLPDAAPSGAPQAAATATPAVTGPERRILAFGDSLFAGYRLGEDEGYPEKLQNALRARGINAHLIDAAVSGDTSGEGRSRLGFTLDSMNQMPDLALVELGGNDMLRGLSPDAAKTNLATILAILKKRQIPVVLMGMRAPPNAGPEYRASFDAMYPALAKKYGATLVPFFLQPIYDKPALLQADHIHPTAEGVDALVAATVDTVEKALPKKSGSRD